MKYCGSSWHFFYFPNEGFFYLPPESGTNSRVNLQLGAMQRSRIGRPPLQITPFPHPPLNLTGAGPPRDDLL